MDQDLMLVEQQLFTFLTNNLDQTFNIFFLSFTARTCCSITFACAKTKSVPSYRYSIKQRATTVTDSFATKVVIYQKVPRSLYLFDWKTHYTGYYTSGTSAVITGISGEGYPYVMFGGFRTIYNDLPIKIEGPFGTVISKLTNYCVPSSIFLYNFNGQNLGHCTVGVSYTTSTLPYGTNTFKITVDDDVIIYTIIRQ